MRTTMNILAGLALISTSVNAQAQDHRVDIGLHEGADGTLEVRLVPRSDLDGIVSGLVFTLRWERASDASLGAVLQDGSVRSCLPVRASGAVEQEGDYYYQVFSGEGMQPLAGMDLLWEADHEYTIATIPVHGHAQVALLNDAWTDDIHHNGTFFVSLGGRLRTGSILKSMAMGGRPELQLSVVPNPNQGRFTITFQTPDEGDVRIELMSSSGKLVYEQVVEGPNGLYRKDMDLSGMSAGVYHLKLVQRDRTVIRKIMVQ
ncbi:MAG TPA: T9SS type A sorting domain-containing protein [Flavobacteriales bacterium]